MAVYHALRQCPVALAARGPLLPSRFGCTTSSAADCFPAHEQVPCSEAASEVLLCSRIDAVTNTNQIPVLHLYIELLPSHHCHQLARGRHPAGAPGDRNYAFDDDIVGTVNFGILAAGQGLRLQTASVNGAVTMINNGGIAASGTHAELLASSPIYQEIYRSQLEKGTVRHA